MFRPGLSDSSIFRRFAEDDHPESCKVRLLKVEQVILLEVGQDIYLQRNRESRKYFLT
jgi:hypothetical protein